MRYSERHPPSPVRIDVESDGFREGARHEAVIPHEDLDLDVQLREVAEERRIRLGGSRKGFRSHYL
jgi:hypothetical protein